MLAAHVQQLLQRLQQQHSIGDNETSALGHPSPTESEAASKFSTNGSTSSSALRDTHSESSQVSPHSDSTHEDFAQDLSRSRAGDDKNTVNESGLTDCNTRTQAELDTIADTRGVSVPFSGQPGSTIAIQAQSQSQAQGHTHAQAQEGAQGVDCTYCGHNLPSATMLQLHLIDAHRPELMALAQQQQQQYGEQDTNGSALSAQMMESDTDTGAAGNGRQHMNMNLQMHMQDNPALNHALGSMGMLSQMHQMGMDGKPKVFNPEAYCELCEKEFCNKYYLATHKATKHGIGSNMFGAQSLAATFAQQPSLFSNFASSMANTNNNDNASANGNGSEQDTSATNTFLCPLCGEKCFSPLQLQTHMLTAHTPQGTALTLNNYDTPNEDTGTGAGSAGTGLGGAQSPSLSLQMAQAQDNLMGSGLGQAFYTAQLMGLNPFNANHNGQSNGPAPNMMELMRLLGPMAAAANAGQMGNGHGGSTPPATLLDHYNTANGAQGEQQRTPPHTMSMQEMLLPANTSAQSCIPGSGSITNGTVNMHNTPNINREAYCEFCCKEFCNKYFLRTHKLKKHGIVTDEPLSGSGRKRSSVALSQSSNSPSRTTPRSLAHELGMSPNKLLMSSAGMFDYPSHSQGQGQTQCNGQLSPRHSVIMNGLPNQDYNAPNAKQQKLQTDIDAVMQSINQVVQQTPNNNNTNSSASANANNQQMNNNKFDLNAMMQTMISQGADGVQSGQQDTLTCDQCCKCFTSMFSLVAHRYRDHGTATNNHTNDQDSADDTATADNSSTEMNTDNKQMPLLHDNDVNEPNLDAVDPETYCDRCHKEFSNTYFLRLHRAKVHNLMDTHSDSLSALMPQSDPFGHLLAAQDSDSDREQMQQLALIGSPTAVGSRAGRMVAGKNYCDLCNKQVCNKYFLRTHMLKMHGLVIDENKTVIGNINTVDKERLGSVIFRCNLCNEQMSTRHELKEHKQQEHGMAPAPCLSGTVSGYSSDDALQPATSSTSFQEVCPVCDERFKQATLLWKHMRSQHSGVISEQLMDSFLHIAEQFEQQQAQLPSLSLGGADCSMVEENPLQCATCAQVFTDQVQLNVHVVQSHSLADIQRSALQSLNGQLQSQSHSTPVSPQKSSVSANEQSAAPAPISMQQNGSKLYRCSYCEYYTRWISNLSVHEKRHAGAAAVNQLGVAEKPHVCTVCLRSYRYAHSLDRHKQVHKMSAQLHSIYSSPQKRTVNSPIKSPIKRSQAAVNSERAAVGSKRYRCTKCEKVFKSRELCRSHLYAMHRRHEVLREQYAQIMQRQTQTQAMPPSPLTQHRQQAVIDCVHSLVGDVADMAHYTDVVQQQQQLEQEQEDLSSTSTAVATGYGRHVSEPKDSGSDYTLQAFQVQLTQSPSHTSTSTATTNQHSSATVLDNMLLYLPVRARAQSAINCRVQLTPVHSSATTPAQGLLHPF